MDETDPACTTEPTEPTTAAQAEPPPEATTGPALAAKTTPAPTTFICSDCGKRSMGGGNCSACGQGPLLDLSDPSVIATLGEADVQRRLRRERLLVWIAIPIAVVPVLALVFTVPFVLALVPLPIPFGNPIKVLVAITLVAFGVSKALGRTFPVKALFSEVDAPAASTADVAAAMRRGSTQRIALVVGVLAAIGVVVGGASVWMKVKEAAAQARAGLAMAALRTCLVGEMEPGESVASRMRRIHLSAGAAAPSPDWPGRCAQHGDKLFAELEPRGAAGRLRDLLGSKAGCETGCQGEGLLASIQDLVAAAHAAHLPAGEAADVVGPPLADMSLLRAKDFSALGPKDLQLRDSTILAGGNVALLYQTSASKLHVCEVDIGANEVSCAPVPDNVRVAAASAKLARGESEPLVYGITYARVTGGRDALGNERNPDKPGEAQKTEVERGAFWARSGARAALYHGPAEGIRNGVLLEREGSGIEIVTVSEGQEPSRRTLDLPTGAQGPWVVDGFVVHVAEDGSGRGLFARSPSESRAKSVGPLRGYSFGAPTVCRTGETVALVLGDRADTQVSFLGKGGFSAPVSAKGATLVGPEPPPPAPPPAPRPSSTAKAAASSKPAPATSASVSSKYAVRGPAENPDPHIARQQSLKDAAEFGMIGLLNAGAGGDPDAPTAPWGRDDSLGSAFGGLGELSGLGRSGARASSEALPQIKSAAIDGADVACSGGSVSHTWLVEKGSLTEVHQVRCTPAGCQHEYAKVRGLGVKSLWLATSLGDKALLVFRGALGDVRLRTAPLAELGTALDTVIMDSPEYGGPETGESHVLASAAGVMVLFRGESLFGLRIGVDGKHEVVRAR